MPETVVNVSANAHAPSQSTPSHIRHTTVRHAVLVDSSVDSLAMTGEQLTRRVYSAEELHRLRTSCSQPKLHEAIEEHDSEDAELVKGKVCLSALSTSFREHTKTCLGTNLARSAAIEIHSPHSLFVSFSRFVPLHKASHNDGRGFLANLPRPS